MGSIGKAESSALRRGNSISGFAPTILDLSSNHRSWSSSFPKEHSKALGFELVSLRPISSYTSLKDLIQSPSSSIQSPTGFADQSFHEISIKNRLVKLAASAYLQPMASSPNVADGDDFFRRILTWVRSSSDYIRIPFTGFLGFFQHHMIPTICRAFSRLLGVLRIRSSSSR